MTQVAWRYDGISRVVVDYSNCPGGWANIGGPFLDQVFDGPVSAGANSISFTGVVVPDYLVPWPIQSWTAFFWPPGMSHTDPLSEPEVFPHDFVTGVVEGLWPPLPPPAPQPPYVDLSNPDLRPTPVGHRTPRVPRSADPAPVPIGFHDIPMGIGQEPRASSGFQWTPDLGSLPPGNDVRRDPDDDTVYVVRPPERPY